MQSSTVERIRIRHGCLMKMDHRAGHSRGIGKAVSTPWEVVGTGCLIRGESYSR